MNSYNNSDNPNDSESINGPQGLSGGYYTLDRFEGEYAVIIDGNTNAFALPRSIIPKSAREGDSICYDDNCFTVDYSHTRQKKQDIQSRFNRLKKKR